MEKLGMPAAAARAPLEGVFAQRPEKADERASLFSQRHLNKKVYLTMSTLSIKLKEEFIALLPPTLFFFVALHLVALIRVLMLKGTGIALSTSWQVTLSALILGKTVLVADLLPFINRYPDKPLIYNVAWKTTIYVLVAMLVHYLEHLVDFWKAASSL